jgi:hypothetical protein
VTQRGAFGPDEFRLQIGQFVGSAFFARAIAEVTKTISTPGAASIWENEARRLVRLQLPTFLRRAATAPKVDRLQDVRNAVHCGAKTTDEVWSKLIRLRAKTWHVEPSAIRILNKNQETEFFDDMLARCEGELTRSSLLAVPRFPLPAFQAGVKGGVKVTRRGGGKGDQIYLLERACFLCFGAAGA